MAKRLIPATVAMVLLLAVPCVWAQVGGADAEGIVRRAYGINGGNDSYSLLKFTFEERGGKQTGATLVMGFKRGGEGDLDYKVIMFNRYPPDRKDVGFLGWFYRGETGKEADMWLYLPELRLVRRLVHGHGNRAEAGATSREDQSDEFSISQLNLEELMPRWPGLDQHRVLGTAQVDEKTVYMIESTPRDSATSSYGKRIQWITKDEGLPIKIEYYDEDMTLLKTQTLTWRRAGGSWVWDRVAAINNVTGARTVLEQTDMRVDVGLPDSLFTKRALSLGANAFESQVKKIARPTASP